MLCLQIFDSNVQPYTWQGEAQWDSAAHKDQGGEAEVTHLQRLATLNRTRIQELENTLNAKEAEIKTLTKVRSDVSLSMCIEVSRFGTSGEKTNGKMKNCEQLLEHSLSLEIEANSSKSE